MSAGSVIGQIVLDHPSKYHCGPDDPVTGHVALTYHACHKKNSSTGELQSLFGPLKVFADFTGRAKTKIHKSNGNTSSTYRGRAPLFAQHCTIYDGPCNAKPGECVRYPFTFKFPACTQPMLGQGDFRQDIRFHEGAGGPLPPTFGTSNTGFSKSFVAFVEYRIGASIRMPGIDVEIRGLDREETRPYILYEQPAPPVAEIARRATQQFSNSASFQNEFLLPEDERPSGFRQKARFKFSSQEYPTYVFDIVATAPAYINLGQPLTFELSIHPNFNRCTAPLPPEIKLSSFRIGVRSHVVIRAEYGFLSSQESDKSSYLPGVSAEIMDHDVPFCKANDHTKIVRTRTPVMGAQSSFSTYNICQQYTLEIEYGILAAGKNKTFKRKVPLTIYGPLVGNSSSQPMVNGTGYAEASSSAAATTVQTSANVTPNPPTDLPEYERPPEYDQVLDTRTENGETSHDSMDKGKAVAL